MLGLRALAAAFSIACLHGCGEHPSGVPGTAPSPSAGAREVGVARRLADPRTPLPPRAEVLAAAESIAARADKEGEGARATELRTLAARVLERAWRIDAQDGDASEALALYRAASRDRRTPGACEAALRAAGLAGDFAHDAAIAYAELHRLEAPGSSSRVGAFDGQTAAPCDCDARAALGMLAASRPAQGALDAIDEGLQEEGAVASAFVGSADAGAPPSQGPPRIVRVDAWPGRDAARVVVELDRPAAYRTGDEVRAGALSPSTFVELDGVDLAGPPRDIAEVGIVTRVRTEASSTGSRVSLDLDGHAFRRVFYMREPYRVVLDVARRSPGFVSRGLREVSRVVVDPGHGGKDTGAVGPAGTLEKDVTLDVARRVAHVLTGQGISVLLTRDDDRFVTLEERTARANAFSADLFVSIHCNASEGHGRRGVETYILDTTRDEIALRIAARENATTQAASADLASMLSGMRLADQAQRSTRFARLLERAAVVTLQMRYADVVDGGVHVAGFYVLVGARMPGVLFESSYISNAAEEQRLESDEYRQLLADAVANGVEAYRQGR